MTFSNEHVIINITINHYIKEVQMEEKKFTIVVTKEMFKHLKNDVLDDIDKEDVEDWVVIEMWLPFEVVKVEEIN